MASSVSSDIERIILEIEFENQQYVKRIEKERQEIESLENQEQLVTLEVKQEEALTPTLDASTKSLHKQFTQNRDNIQSLKKTLEVLDDHEKALTNKLKGMKLQAEEDGEEREKMLEHYQNVWTDYEACYKTFPKVSELEKKNEELEETKQLHKEAFEKWQSVTQELESVKRETEETFMPYANLNSFMVKIAEMYQNYKKTEQDVVNSQIQYSQDLDRLNEAREQLVQQKLQEEEEERQRVIAEKRAKEIQMEKEKNKQPTEEVDESSQLVPNQTQQSDVMQKAQFNMSIPKPGFLEMPKMGQLSTNTNRIPCLTMPSPVANARAKNSDLKTLQMSNGGLSLAQNNTSQHMTDGESENLLRQVQEMQLQKKFETLAKSSDQREFKHPQLAVPQSRYTGSMMATNNSPMKMGSPDIYQKHPTPENLAPCSPMINKLHIEQPKLPMMQHQMSQLQRQQSHSLRTPSRPLQQQMAISTETQSVQQSDLRQQQPNMRQQPDLRPQQLNIRNESQLSPQQPDMTQEPELSLKTPENTPNRPDTAKTPNLYLSPSHDGDSPFDVDKLMEKAKKYAAKSPGVASVFKQRPMYGSKNADKNKHKDTSQQMSKDANFGGLRMLNSASRFFNGSGDGSAAKSAELNPGGRDDTTSADPFSFNFGAEKSQPGSEKPADLNLGGSGDNRASDPFSFNFGAEKPAAGKETSSALDIGGSGDHTSGQPFSFNFTPDKNAQANDNRSWDFKFGNKDETTEMFNFGNTSGKMDKGLGEFGFDGSALSMLTGGGGDHTGKSSTDNTSFNFDFTGTASTKACHSESEPMKLF